MLFSLCTDMLFPGQLTHTLLPEIKSVGYDAVEFWRLDNKDEKALADALSQTGLSLAAFCTSHMNLVDSTQRETFLNCLKESVSAANRLSCPTLIVTVGQRLEGVSDEIQLQSILDGLHAAVPILENSGVSLVVEPLNVADHSGHFLARSDIAFSLLREINHPSIRLLFDIYHQQVTEGNLIHNITQNIDYIGHFHVADTPGRHDPGTGEIHWSNVFKAISQSGYSGFVGFEYDPIGDAKTSMANVLHASRGSHA